MEAIMGALILNKVNVVNKIRKRCRNSSLQKVEIEFFFELGEPQDGRWQPPC
jgi:hypothetical protein